MEFIRQIADFIISPTGLAAALTGAVLYLYTLKSTRGNWFLFSLCCYAASLSVYVDEFRPIPPALIFPLQQLREFGRPLAIFFLGLIVVTSMVNRIQIKKVRLPSTILTLASAQAVIITKTMIFGSFSFAILVLGTYMCVICMIFFGPVHWLQSPQGFKNGVWSISMLGLIFISANGYQAIFDIYPITFVNGQLLGTTGNPQHAAVLLVSVIPAILYMIETNSIDGRTQYFWVGILLITLFFVFLTGSRTGMFTATIALVFFYRERAVRLFRIITISIIVAFGSFIFIDVDTSPLGTTIDRAIGKANDTNNTRAHVWSSLWSTFLKNPVAGKPLNGGRLSGYGESSWLGAAASLGILGLAPLLIFGLQCVRLVIYLIRLSNRNASYFAEASMVIAGIVSLMLGSITEAFLLGTITSTLFILLLYITMAHHLLENRQIALQDRLKYLKGFRQSNTLKKKRNSKLQHAQI